MLQYIVDFIRNSIAQFDVIRDTIDILLVAFLIYYLLKLTKGTRAMSVLKGLGIILIISWVTAFMRLNAITWVLNYVIASGAIVIVILFQPELRRALEHLGRGRFDRVRMWGKSTQEDGEYIIQEISRALINLAKRRAGALVVVERRTGLAEIYESGTRIGGFISSALIENIFEPNAPLHDGAIMIRGQEIVAAGCFLPLSDDHEISRELGTRHRAALGVSQISDCLCFIVSEETGVISLAREGKLIRYLDMKAIREALAEEYLKKEEKRSFWKRAKDES
ncbi:MAG: diadenylate cyclase CdaA [Bacillota bacterium]|nr:diadenylate cyclase CdaA [Bacillota bacterium]